jgi:hypothetical protein
MAISVFPVATSASASGLSKAVILPSASTYYTLVDATLTAGNYTITSPSTIPVIATFYNSSYTQIATGTTTSGTVSIAVNSDASRVMLIADAGSNINVTIQLTGLVLSPTFTSAGTETITSTQTYTGTSTSGYAFVLTVGGGGGGGIKWYFCGAGGGSGGVNTGIVPLDGSSDLIVGAAGGQTSFDGYLVAGGGGGGAQNGFGAAGVPNGGNGGGFPTGPNGNATPNLNKYILNGTTGGGGASTGPQAPTNGQGAGSGIGTGGNGDGGSGTGFGSGGAGSNGGTPGTGRPGVIYMRRF